MSYRQDDPRREKKRSMLDDTFEFTLSDADSQPEQGISRLALFAGASSGAAASAATALNDLTDVNVPSPTNEQVLRYNFTDSVWEAASLTSIMSDYGDDEVDAHLNSLTSGDWRDYDHFEDAVDDTDSVSSATDWITSASDNIYDAVNTWGTLAWAALTNFGAGVASTLGAIWASISSMGETIWDTIEDIGNTIWTWLSNINAAARNIWDSIIALGAAAWNVIDGIGSAIWTWLSNIGTTLHGPSGTISSA